PARPDLLAPPLAAAELIVWFGTGSEPLGKSARPQATRPAAGSGTSAPKRALAPLPPPGSRCTLEAQEIGGATFVIASGCGKAVTGVTVVLGGPVVSPAYYMTPAESAALSCPVQGSRVRCRVKPP